MFGKSSLAVANRETTYKVPRLCEPRSASGMCANPLKEAIATTLVNRIGNGCSEKVKLYEIKSPQDAMHTDTHSHSDVFTGIYIVDLNYISKIKVWKCILERLKFCSCE